MPRVTESLRRQWAMQREQSIEERTHTQSGEPRSPADIAIVDWEIAVMDKMLSLPMGTKFDGQQIQKEMRDACLCAFENGVLVRTDDGCPTHSKRPGVANHVTT